MENKNGIGRIGLIALIVSSCIGTGIFGITNAVAAAAAPGPALLAWLFVGFGSLMLVFALNNLWGNLFPVGPTGCQLGWVTLPLPPC